MALFLIAQRPHCDRARLASQRSGGAAAGVAGRHLARLFSVDGVLSEPAWMSAPVADDSHRAIRPKVRRPRRATTVRCWLTSCHRHRHGLRTARSKGSSASASVATLRSTTEDHVRIVLGPFLDGRSGYVFAVNPTGARYDGLINPGGENDNPDWDGIWEAATARLPNGWSVEIRIPVLTLAFKPGLHEWHFNVQRRIQRRLETDRWASPTVSTDHPDQPRRSADELPEFSLGVGLTMRPAVTSGGGVPSPDAAVEGDFQPSLDVSQRIGANVLASVNGQHRLRRD